MSDEEVETLRAALAMPPSFFGQRSAMGTYVGGGFVGLLGGSVPASALAAIRHPWALWTWFAFGLAGLAAAHFMYRRSVTKSSAATVPYAADLQSGVVEEIECSVSKAVVVEEAEDEGIACLLDLGDHDILFLRGQYLYDAVDERQFPAERVRVARARLSRAVLTFEYAGNPLPGISHVSPTALKRDLVDGQALRGRLDDYVDLGPSPQGSVGRG